jgi:transcriptional regulator with XRE-family HTH domain
VTRTPPVRRRLLGSALRSYRLDLGYNLEDAAHVLDCDRSKMSRIETGDRGIGEEELQELLSEYGVPAAEQEALLAVAHRGRETGWWQDYRHVLPPEAQDFVAMEMAATEILVYEALQVPDLLQTVDYMRAVLAADARYTQDEQRAHAMEVKVNRQRVVLADRAPSIHAVITEGALRQTVGPPRVSREQLDRLAALAETGFAQDLPDTARPEEGRSRVSVQVLPFAAGAHAAAGCGPMTLLRFGATREIGVIHLPTVSGGVSFEGRAEVAQYLRVFAQLSSAALNASRSAHLIRAVSRSYNNRVGT